MQERQLYPSVISWFNEKLRNQYKRSEIAVFDTSRVNLWRFLRDQNLHALFPDYLTYEIRIDITAIIKSKTKAELAFIECKVGEITLRDVSQLLGYSRVANPVLSILLSPKSVSRSMHHLLKSYLRYDVLNYAPNRRIRICLWDQSKKEIDARHTLPPGEHV